MAYKIGEGFIMLKEIMLTDEERGTILEMCALELLNLQSNACLTRKERITWAAQLGLVVCRIKGVVPHFNARFIMRRSFSTVPSYP